MKRLPPLPPRTRGFTLIELLIGGTIMLLVVLGALSIYSRSNKISVDQQQYIDLQHDVRAAMYFIARDVRMAGAGLPFEYAPFFLEVMDNESGSGPASPDRMRILGNIEEPLAFRIASYQGSAAIVTFEDFSFESYPYPDDHYLGKTVIVLPNPASACRGAAFRRITHVRHDANGVNEGFNFSPGQAPGINPPGGLSDICPSDDFDGGLVLFADAFEYWLDTTGFAAGLTAGQNGYIGLGAGNVLYVTRNGVHTPLAKNIETIQFQCNGDLDDNGALDGFVDWNPAWTAEQVGRIRQVRIQILGRTPDSFASVNKSPSPGIHLYRRPAVANVAAASSDDWHRRFLLETTSTIRNLAINIYNRGER